MAIFSFANFEATLARFTRAAFGMADDENFLVFAAIGAVLVVAGGLCRPLAKRCSEISLMTAGLFQMIAGLGGLAVVSWLIFEGGVDTDLTQFLTIRTVDLRLPSISLRHSRYGGLLCEPLGLLVSRSADSSEQGEVLR